MEHIEPFLVCPICNNQTKYINSSFDCPTTIIVNHTETTHYRVSTPVIWAFHDTHWTRFLIKDQIAVIYDSNSNPTDNIIPCTISHSNDISVFFAFINDSLSFL